MASNDSLLTNPSWPSLYNPRAELFDIEHHDPIQPGGFYLLNPQDVFRFTLYWTLVFYIPVFVLFGSYAFFNLTFPPSNSHSKALKALEDFHNEERQGGHEGIDNESEEDAGEGETYPMSPNPKPHKSKNACRSRLTFALLVFFGFLLLSLIGAVVSSAIVGYILTALYKAGDFYMSTWVPFLWAAISVMVGMLNVWPSIIDLI
ncbi:hypothetical protein EV361DRAFT_805605 [Lentinula raphanica]|nr:hypothetical protein EV360DRAFT_41822 [Lentinula raphanica]KAJ3968441.1 hypothetical protein EV361DRAFT_805605 [Lentinula raphanica]